MSKNKRKPDIFMYIITKNMKNTKYEWVMDDKP